MNRREDRTWRLSIEGERRDGVLVLTVAGRLDAASSGDLTDRLMDSVNTGVVVVEPSSEATVQRLRP
jgi:hypothetical protein